MNTEDFEWNMDYWSKRLTDEQEKIQPFFERMNAYPYANPTLKEMATLKEYILQIGSIEANLAADIKLHKSTDKKSTARKLFRR